MSPTATRVRRARRDGMVCPRCRTSGQPRGANNGKIVVLGYASRGRILKIVLTPDQQEIITLAWPDE